MSSSLAVYEEPKSAMEIELEECEAIIREAEVNAFEEWFRIATELMRIKAKKLFSYPGSGIKGWAAYCRSDRCDYKLSHADQLIRSATYRKALPKPPAKAGGSWTERTVRPLTKLSSPSSASSCAEKILKRCKKTGEALTAKLVEEEVREAKNTVREKKARAKKAAEDAASTTPGKNLNRLLQYTRKHHQVFANWDGADWQDAEDEFPNIATRVAEALEELASLLRS